MVKPVIFLLLIFPLCAVAGKQYTVEEIRKLTEQAEAQASKRRNAASAASPLSDLLLEFEKETEPGGAASRIESAVDDQRQLAAKAVQPVSDGSVTDDAQELAVEEKKPAKKQAAQSTATATEQPATKTGTSKKQVAKKTTPTTKQRAAVSSEDEYIPPPKQSTSGSGVSSDIKMVDGVNFGITIGTWFDGRLERHVTNVDASLIEVTLTRTVPGKHRDLPAGTTLYGDGSLGFNQRMGIKLNLAVTPDKREFPVDIEIYDMAERSGLAGTIDRDRSDELAKAAKKSSFAMAGSLLSNVGGSGGALSEGTQVFTDQVLETEKSGHNLDSIAVILVPPQTVRLRAESTF